VSLRVLRQICVSVHGSPGLSINNARIWLTNRPNSLPETCLSAARSILRVSQLFNRIARSASSSLIVGQHSPLHRLQANSSASLCVFSAALDHIADRVGSSVIRRLLMSSVC